MKLKTTRGSASHPGMMGVGWGNDSRSGIKDSGKEATDVKTYQNRNCLDLVSKSKQKELKIKVILRM